MTTQSIHRVKIGNMRAPESFADISEPGCRPKKQWEALLAYHRTHPSAFWCGNPFGDHETIPDGRYNCTFSHSYFDTQGTYRVVRITPTGRIGKEYKGDKNLFQEETDAVIAAFGAFTGN